MKFKKNLKIYLIWLAISLVVGAVIFLCFYLSNKSKLGALDGTSFAGVILICCAGLIFVTKQGFFDFASYGIRQFGSMLFAKKPNAYNDFAGYKEYKTIRRKNDSYYYAVIAIVGVLFLISYFIIRAN